MDVLSKAKELGELILESDDYKRFQSAEASLHADEKGMKLFDEIRRLQESFSYAMHSENHTEVETIKLQFSEKNAELQQYTPTKEYILAKQAMDSLLKKVNDIVMFTITGEQASSCCGGGCGCSSQEESECGCGGNCDCDESSHGCGCGC